MRPFDPPPVAGPSSRPYNAPPDPCALGDCPLLKHGQNHGAKRRKRQDPSPTTNTSPSASESSSFAVTTTNLFPTPSTASPTLSSSISAIASSSAGPSSASSSGSSSTSSSTYSRTFTGGYTYTRPSPSPSAPPPIVPGVLLNLTLGGDRDDEAVYGVQVTFGHGPSGQQRRRAPRVGNANSLQNMTLQVDLGSSDMWVASMDCKMSDCNSAPMLFNATNSIPSGVNANLTYYSGAASGEIYWEEVNMGGFEIGYQAFVAADMVSNEDLSGGDFSGILGLALPAASEIISEIPGTTGSNPDGATFLNNLFGSGLSAPTARLFSLSLARREDVRTRSELGLGIIDPSFCAPPCNITYMPIVAQPQLGATGFVHWRVSLSGISYTTWSDQQNGAGNTTKSITLGPSQVVTSRNMPLTVFDSGGVPILVGYQPYIAAIYGAYGVTASADGLYRMPCTMQMAFTFHFAGGDVPVHPLDMSWPDPADPSQQTCIGALQYASALGETGDMILGSSFLKNVYSIFQYPDYISSRSSVWQPTIGIVPLTNASLASQDFYAVRVLHQPLSTVSTNGNPVAPGGGTTTAPPQGSGGGGGKAMATTGAIVGSVVGGVFVIAVAAFCAWWFWLRRKYGAGGVVDYRSAGKGGHKPDMSMSSVRTRKHEVAQRQKSMVEGYSDFEGDSWVSTTEGDDSIRMGYMPEVPEEARDSRPEERSSRGSSVRDSSAKSTHPAATPLLEDAPEPVVDVPFTDSPTSPVAPRPELVPAVVPPANHNRQVSFSTAVFDTSLESPPLSTTPKPYPQPTSARSLSMSMSGPFPSPMRPMSRHDTSPYDIRSSDYFTIIPTPGSAGGAAASRGREGRRTGSGGQRDVSMPRMQSPSGRIMGDSVVEEPHELSTPPVEK